MIPYRNRSYISDKDPLYAEALDDIMRHVEGVMQQTNTAPTSATVMPPPKASKLTVTASQGIFDASIEDNNSSVARGITYHLEHDTTPAFSDPKAIYLGPARNWRGQLGNQTLYWRVRTSYLTSAPGDPVYHNGGGTSPLPVSGGGVITGPTPQASNGSGTSQGTSGSDGAWGKNPFRGSARPTVYSS